MATAIATTEVRLRSRLGQYVSSLQAGADAALDEIRDLMEENVKDEAPRVTGNLQNATTAMRQGTRVFGFTIVDMAPYAPGVHDGNPGHPIVKRNGRGPLANNPGSNTPNDPSFFAQSGEVNHPGNAPNPYLQRAYDRTWPEAMDIVDAHIN